MTKSPKAKPKAEAQTLELPGSDAPSMKGTLKKLGGSQDQTLPSEIEAAREATPVARR